MPLINLCLDRRAPVVKIEVFGKEGQSVAEYEYRNVDLIEVRGTVRIDYTTFSLPKNVLCISIESSGDIRVVGRVLKIV
ncbi:MAG: hypothetical protein N3D82_03165 [Ignisphaera sp.]|nr:hypothetical protein [Ignisphaera sp.]